MAGRPPGNTYELRCNEAFYGLLVEALRLHSLRTRRLQSFRKLVEYSLRDQLWRVIPFDADDMRQLVRNVGNGPIVVYLSLGASSVETLRAARSEVQTVIGSQLSNMEILAAILRLSLDVGGGEWAGTFR